MAERWFLVRCRIRMGDERLKRGDVRDFATFDLPPGRERQLVAAELIERTEVPHD